MELINKLYHEALRRGLLEQGAKIGLAEAFTLVRDMPYRRASDRQPETLINEWRGTCSGKHYLLKALYGEMGYRSQVMACTSVNQIDEDKLPPELLQLWQETNGRFVDVHNYLLLELPEGQMIVDATLPLSSKNSDLEVNETFTLGQDHKIAAKPLQTWVIPEGIDPQAFKEKLLREQFTSAELSFREAFIHAISDWLEQGAEA